MRSCTILRPIWINRSSATLVDCIAAEINGVVEGMYEMENCDLFTRRHSIEGIGCFTADPQFRDPANLDYRLMPTSPCIGKATDGGDIGCRYTPEMIEMCKIALALRARGIISF